MDTSQPVSSAGAQVTLGIVASVRPVSISVAKVGAMASINAVLGALSQRYIEPPVAGEEIVIRRDDGNTAAIVEQDEAVSLVAGDRVALIVSSPAVIIRRN
jgi:outer membrane lipoprotein SlyB